MSAEAANYRVFSSGSVHGNRRSEAFTKHSLETPTSLNVPTEFTAAPFMVLSAVALAATLSKANPTDVQPHTFVEFIASLVPFVIGTRLLTKDMPALTTEQEVTTALLVSSYEEPVDVYFSLKTDHAKRQHRRSLQENLYRKTQSKTLELDIPPIRAIQTAPIPLSLPALVSENTI